MATDHLLHISSWDSWPDRSDQRERTWEWLSVLFWQMCTTGRHFRYVTDLLLLWQNGAVLDWIILIYLRSFQQLWNLKERVEVGGLGVLWLKGRGDFLSRSLLEPLPVWKSPPLRSRVVLRESKARNGGDPATRRGSLLSLNYLIISWLKNPQISPCLVYPLFFSMIIITFYYITAASWWLMTSSRARYSAHK